MMWFNPYGFGFMAGIMIPNILFALKHKQDGFANAWHNKSVEALEQIGRFGCFIFMIFNIPHTWFGFCSDEAFAFYLIGNAVLALLYCLIWTVCFRKISIFRALALSILPSLSFLLSGVLLRSIPLTAAAILFAPCHIIISYQNATLSK